MDLPEIRNPFLRAHLAYTENTESPRLMHVWAAVAAASACTGRHAWLDFGLGKLFANMYVLLVGPPGTRKNHAIRFATDILQEATNVRLAPDDTSGQRQGLITAMQGNDSDKIAYEDAATIDVADVMSTIDAIEKTTVQLNGVDRHVMFAIATEFGSFLGQNNLDLMRFLIKLWDGETYRYQLRKEYAELEDPLLTLVGGTTPTDIATLMPAEAMGQGLMSRVVLVFAPRKEKHVPPSQARLEEQYRPFLAETYAWLHSELRGRVAMSDEVLQHADKYYGVLPTMNDNRFMYYLERRYTHLLKLAMILAVTSRRQHMEMQDLDEAHMLLSATEKLMPEALGEYGLSPLANARQKLVEFIQASGEPVPQRTLWLVMRNDLKLIDFHNTLLQLTNAKRITEVTTNAGKAYVYNDAMAAALHLLEQDVETSDPLQGLFDDH